MHDIAPRFKRVYELIGQGLTNKEIATQLNIGYEAVKIYCSELYRALGCGRHKIIATYQASLHEKDTDSPIIPEFMRLRSTGASENHFRRQNELLSEIAKRDKTANLVSKRYRADS